MAAHYPWPEPPERGQAVVRLRPLREGQEDDGDVVALEWAGESFTRVRPADKAERRRLARDPLAGDPLTFATPGLLDIQINGYWGRGFKDIDLGPEGVRDLCWSIALTGSTSFLPTVTTDALEVMGQAMANLDAACRLYPDVEAMVSAIHQEGPWISPEDGPRGAHAQEYVRPPDGGEFRKLQEASGGRIRLLTVAPEEKGAIDFIREISASGVAVSLGHHQADGATIRRAVEAGARCVTHLGNGCHNTMPRHPNLIWQQAAEDRLYAGLIVDGHHLPRETVLVLYRAKPRDRLIVVSDAVEIAGAPPGLYRVRGGLAEKTAQGRFGFAGTPTLIGAAVPVARCLANLAGFLEEGRTPADYIDHVTQVPAALLDLPDPAKVLGQPGAPATFVLWRWEPDVPDLVPLRIVLRGRTIYDLETLPVEVSFGRLPERVPTDAPGSSRSRPTHSPPASPAQSNSTPRQ
jgi:N-acetylglucosamine-6-phosphate deacetylase